MRLENLTELFNKHRTDPHYQFRDLTEDKFLEAAKKSFSRLQPEQRTRVEESWGKALTSAGKQVTKESVGDLLRFRFLAQTNLFFLCHLLEKYNRTTLGSHEVICNKFFVRKDPSYLTFRQFANTDYSDLKRRLLLTPRGGFKSSLNIADSVQWIIGFPWITILILTGVYKLAGDFVGELRQHFTLEELGDKKYGPRKIMNEDTGEWTESVFQVLFPEHCIPPGEGSQLEFRSPASNGGSKEPTVRAASIEQALSGMHFDVLKLDDVVTNENSQTVTRLEAVNKQISINAAMLHPYGFMDVIGTWYDEQDYYGFVIKQEEAFAQEQGMLDSIHGNVDSGRFESGVFYKVYLRAAWWPTEAAIKAGKIESEMKKEDWELWCPEILTYEKLLEYKKTDPYFAIKYLNNPRQMHKVKFPRELMVRRTIPHNQLPPQGLIVSTIDTAYSTKSWADFTVMITALISGGRFYIVNMVRGRFNEFQLPAVIAATGSKWKPKRIAIEDSVGVKWMGRELRREMDKLQISIPVEYVSLGLGSKSKSKQLKAKPVLRLLGDERMFFLNSCEGLQEIYTELEKFTGTPDDEHDDIVSAFSLLAEVFGSYADMDAKINFASTQYNSDRQSKEMHDMIYGLGRYASLNAAQMIDDHPVTAFQIAALQEALGAQTDSFVDPFADLM
jgi:phage terminase large subunit-like protein